MVDVTLKIIKEADTFDLLKLSEAKTILNIPTGDVSVDENLKWMITANSALISTMTNRIYGREKLIETWRELGSNKIFLTHWPVKAAEIEEIKCGSTVLTTDQYELEERAGKILLLNGQIEPIRITYTGGYDLPDDAHPTLKYATGLLVGKTRKEQATAALTGVRMIAHKEARVMFHSPTSGGGGASSGTSDAATDKAVESLLYHFIRHWI